MKKSFALALFRLFILQLLFSSVTIAQDQRPKVGLVLSGGGAKGIAHIGILKAMEEAGLTPDFITGTSMGSIVGGLYSIGYSADELGELVVSADWDQLLSNKVPLEKVIYEEKEFYGRYLLDFYLKGTELILPEGVIEGQALMELFSELTRPVHNINNFEDFPIPFNCVAADITNGEPVTLNKGSLALAMRASMAIPTVFTPVRIDGKVLVDGGLVRNVPVPEIEAMGADIIIGVYVGTDLKPEEELNSAITILAQSALITNAFDTRDQLAKCDILIQPDIEEYSTSSFHNAAEILDIGIKEGEKYFQVFKNLKDSLEQFGPLNKPVLPDKPDEYIFDTIIVTGNETVSDDFVIGRLRFKKDKIYSIEYLQERIDLIYGMQYFSKVWYEILKEDDTNILKIVVVERPRIHMRFSYHYDTENKGGIIGNITLRNLLLDKSRLIFEADLATQPHLVTNYFKYIGKRQNFAAGASGVFLRTDLPEYDSLGTNINIYSTQYLAGGLKLQSTVKQNSTVGVEVFWSTTRLKPKVIDESIRFLTKIDYNNTTFKAFYRLNNFDERYFPKKGILANVEFSSTPRVSGNIVFYDTLEIDAKETQGIIETGTINAFLFELEPVFPVTNKFSVKTKARLRISTLNSLTLNLSEMDYIGGFTTGLFRTSEYYGADIKEFVLANYFYARLSTQYEIRRNLFLQAHINYIDTKDPVKWIYPKADIGKVGDRYRRFGYGATIGYNSPIGPVLVSVAKDHYRDSWKAALGIGFYY